MKQSLLILMAAACGGGGGGVDRGVLLVDLTPGEVTDECTFLFDNYPKKTFDCGGGATVSFGQTSVADCETSFDDSISSSPSCTATVGDAEDCDDYLYTHACDSGNGSVPAVCAALFSADCSGSSARRAFAALRR